MLSTSIFLNYANKNLFFKIWLIPMKEFEETVKGLNQYLEG